MASCLPCRADTDDYSSTAKENGAKRSAVRPCAGLLGLLFSWPTAVTAGWMLACASHDRHTRGWPRSGLALAGEALMFELALRAARAAALLLHELSHLAAAAAWLLPAARLRLRAPLGSGAAEQASCAPLLRQFLRQLLPFAVAPGACVALTPRARRALLARGASAEASVRAAGLAASLLLPCGLWVLLWARLHAGDPAATSALAGALLVAAGALLSDLPGRLPWGGPEPPPGCFCCGNWGLLVPRDALRDGGTGRELFPGACESLLLSVLDIVEMRGAQAGGVNTFLSCGGDQVRAVMARALKTKRGRLGAKIFGLFRSRLRWQYVASLLRCRELRGLPVVLAQGHSRFGTSSGPAVVETHPHQWLGPRSEHVWQCDENGTWRCRVLQVCTTITHNGDFDGWTVYDKVVPNGTLGLFLARALHCNNDVKGDSAKLAGMMDLLLCQGMWVASVRLAFVTEVMKHVDEMFGWEAPSRDAPNHAPPHGSIAHWASVFDGVFREALEATKVDSRKPSQEGQFVPTQDKVQALVDALVDVFEAPPNAEEMQRHGVTGVHLKRFVAKACEYFFTMDLLSTVQSFFQRAEGTFGVSVSCTLWPTSIVLASKGQPISLAIDQTRPLVFWSSEPSSLLVGWPVPDARGQRTRAARARFDLNDAAGEALELRIVQGRTAEEQVAALGAQVVLSRLAGAQFLPMPALDAGKVMDHHLLVRGVGLDSAARPLTRDALVARWVQLQNPPPSRRLGNSWGGLDPVAQDLGDVPSVLQQVEDAWKDSVSLNSQSGRKFGTCLSELLARKQRDGGTSDRIDVLVFGIENSLWLGQQFAADLKKVMPMLNVTALSSNWLLGMLQEGHGHLEPRNFAISRLSFRFSEGALVLAVSHSGTTYPTVWAARALHRRHGGHVRLFAMSSVFDTVLANSIGQDLTKRTFTGCLFSTMAGPRPSEPSTVATLAMHHTLSWLLCAAAEAVSAAFPRGRAASGAEPAAGRGAAVCSAADKRPRADTAGRRPWAGKWVDTAKGFFHGATISIEDDSWRLEGSVDHVHEGASFSLGASSEDGVRLIESFPDGFVHMFDASCQEGCLRVVRAGTISARSDGDSPFLETCSKPQEWVLQDLAKVALPVLTLGASDVRDLPHLLRSLLPAAEELCGVSRTGAVAERASEVRASLLLVGRYLASHLLEGWYSLLLSAVYVYVTVTIGYPLISSTWARMRDTAALDENEDEWWWVVLDYVAAHLDAHLYVFMGACLATAHRVCSGRRLFVRYSAKMLVIVDCTVNYKLLRAYVSKLRALAFRFTTFGVAGQNGEDHFVHEMTHLTTSEVVILAGRADGRLGTLASMEAASIMSLQQARFIAANPHTGVEVVSVGHNPWTKPGLFQRSVTLSSEHRPAFYSQELLRSAAGGHSPTDVLHGVAMLAKGDLSSASTRTGSEAAFQDVRIEDIETEMAAKELDLEDAQSIIVKFVSKRSYVLNIDPEDFDVTQVLNADVAARLASQQVRGPVRKGTKDRTMTYSAHSPRPPRNVYSKALTKLRPRSFFAREDPALSQPPPVDPQGGPTSSCSTMPTESVGADWLGFKKSASTGHPSFKFTASNIMSVLRGRTLEAVIAQMQSDRHERMALAKRGGLSDLFSDSDTLRGCYEAWAHFASQRAKERMSRVATLVTTLKTKTDREASAALPPQMAPWRTQEEYRQRKRQWMMHYSMLPFAMPHSTRRCFQSWKEHVEAAKAYRPSVTMKVLNALSPVKAYTTFSPMKAYSPAKATACSSLGTVAEHSPRSSKLLWDNVVKKVLMGGDGDGRVVIGEQQGSKARVTKGASGTDLIAELGYMEGIYETRVAAAERLLAFYIIFHAAVRPLSRLWGLRFDMDRSESRLRVASTPAPVPFVEGTDLDADGPAAGPAAQRDTTTDTALTNVGRFSMRSFSDSESLAERVSGGPLSSY